MSDQRKHSRHAIELPVSFSGDHVSDHGVVLDLSMGGCRIRSGAAIFSGEYLGMLIALPGRDLPLAVALAVVRWSMGLDFGVEFISMSADQQATLQRVLEKIQGPVDRQIALATNGPGAVLRPSFATQEE